MVEKLRVHHIAKELGVRSKVIITKCQAEGLGVTNHMSTLGAGLAATIREWFSEGQHLTTVETATRVDLAKVRVKKRKAKKKAPAPAAPAETADAASSDAAVAATAGAASSAVESVSPPAEAGGTSAPSESVAAASGTDVGESVSAPDVAALTSEEAAPLATETSEGAMATGEAPPTADLAPTAGDADAAADGGVGGGETPTAAASTPVPEVAPEPIVPAGPQNVPRPAQLKGPRVVRYEAPEQNYLPTGPPRRRPVPADRGAAVPPVAAPGDVPGRSRRGRGRGATTDTAQKSRSGTRYSSSQLANEKLKEWRDRDLVERKERISDATGRRIRTHRVSESGGRHAPGMPAGPVTEATVHEPIVMKTFCATVGVSMVQILPILRREFGVSGSLNMELTPEMAEMIALEHGIELTIVPAKTVLDEIREEFENRKPLDVKSRPPVVTFLGHVDHGKTSLLDAIRATRVASKEDGGITQHIGAYFLEHETAGKVTFLDTPGHAAFTAMRARGADLTDIVVLVVAADDGVMPQTVEAINHAKAADVPVVVALNKIDLGTQNVNKIYGQLSEHGFAPSGDWGGETDVIHTSASTGDGIAALVEHLAALGEVLDLKADYGGDATGTVIEAETKEGVGAVVRVLVQRGRLRTGAIVVCGNAFGKVRAVINDRGERVKEAGPCHPVELWGLDEVPVAGDRFFQVKSMHRAKSIAEDMRRRRVSEARAASRRFRSLEDVFRRRDVGGIPELNVIIKADVDGSLEALRSMLGKIPSDEVRLTVRHAAVGAITDSDVLLADASDAVVIGFRVTPGAGAKRLADAKSVDVRQYKVIYEVADDIRKAMEGLLAPDERIENRSSSEVRDVFRISKLGVVAGCYVSDGTVQRSHLLRLVRDGVVVREGCKVGSLRRFKDDAKEVRAGMECGIRIDGFDDVKVGDVIESYEIIKLARTLEMT